MGFSESRILVTGISGFVGLHLTRKLLTMGAEVYGLVRQPTDGLFKDEPALDNISKSNLTLMRGDLTSLKDIIRVVSETEPEFIFHLGAQGVPRESFQKPQESINVNCMGTVNLLEAVRSGNSDPVLVYAGTSHAYGIILLSRKHYEEILDRYGSVTPKPTAFPELPVTESSPLRPTSPYAIGKLAGDLACSAFYKVYGIKSVVSRAFNHEGPGRSTDFVTASIAESLAKAKLGQTRVLTLGNVSVMRDWSHVDDIVHGYTILAESGKRGDLYNLGSGRSNSILTYVLWGLESLGFVANRITSFDESIRVDAPLDLSTEKEWGMDFVKTKIDSMIIRDEISFSIANGGVVINTNVGDFQIKFDESLFSTADSPAVICNHSKVTRIGYRVKHTVKDIIAEQIQSLTNENMP